MSKSSRISKVLAVVAGVCASIPQVGAIPAGVKGKNDVKSGVTKNMNRKMSRPNVKGNNLERKNGSVPSSKSMGPLNRKEKKLVSLAQDVRSTNPKIEVVEDKGTFWRYPNGKVKMGKIIGIPFGTLGGAVVLIGGICYVVKWINGKKVLVPIEKNEEEVAKKDEDDVFDNLNINETEEQMVEDNIDTLKIDDVNNDNNSKSKELYDKFIN